MAAGVIRTLVKDTLAKAEPKDTSVRTIKEEGLKVWEVVMQSEMFNEKDMELFFQVQAYVLTYLLHE